MDSNYEWQKHRVKEHAQTRMREAEAYRMFKRDSSRRKFFLIRAWNWLSAGGESRSQGRQRSVRSDDRKKKARLAGGR